MRNNKLRTILTGISVAWGIFMLIILLGMSQGVYNAFNSGFMAQASNSMEVWGGRTDLPYKGYKEGRSITLKKDDAETINESGNAKIKVAMPVARGNSMTISTPRDYMNTYYRGVTPDFLRTQGHKIVEGRFIDQADINEGRKVVVMSERNVTQLFKSAHDAVGQYVNIGGLAFMVVGVYSSRWGQEVYVPYSTARMLQGYSDDLGSMSVEVQNLKTDKDGEQVEKEVREMLAQNHEFNPSDESAVWIWNRFTQHKKMSNGLDILNMAVWIIGIFTMLSGIIGVSNIMFVSVKERTHEIGIRRAIGAKPRSILRQIIMESVFVTALFGYIGVVMGTAATALINHAFGDTDFMKDPTVTLTIAFQVTVVLIIAGSLAGLFPALRAIKVKPVEALRTE